MNYKIFENIQLIKNNKIAHSYEDDYTISKTADGIEVLFHKNYKQYYEFLPNEITTLEFSDSFNEPVDNLPNHIKNIFFGSKFNQLVDNLHNELKFIQFGEHYNQSIDNLPDSVEQIRITQFYDCKINKLPKSLKIFNVVSKQKYFYDDVDDCEVILTEPIKNYYKIYSNLEKKYPNVEFYY